MTFKQVGYLVSRALAIVLLLSLMRVGLIYIPAIVEMWTAKHISMSLYATAATASASFLIELWLVLYFWFFPQRFVKDNSDEPLIEGGSIPVGELDLLVRRGLGLYFVAVAITSLVGDLAMRRIEIALSAYGSFYGHMAELLIGIYLCWSGLGKTTTAMGKRI